MSDILGSFFDKQVVPSRALGAFAASTLGDGIITGCELSYSGNVLSISRGHLIAGGRLMEIPAEISVSLSGSVTGYGRVIIQIDLTKTATKTEFEQVDILTDYSTTLTGFGTLTQQNINLDGTIYQMPFCVCSLGSGGITGIVESAAQLRPRTGFSRLYRNPAPTASFAAQQVDIPGMSKFNTFLIGHRAYADEEDTSLRWEIFRIEPEERVAGGEIKFNLFSHWTTTSWGDAMYQRRFWINLEEEYFRFHKGWAGGGSTGTDNKINVPFVIYGLNMEEPLGISTAKTTTLPTGGSPSQFLGIADDGSIVWMDAPENSEATGSGCEYTISAERFEAGENENVSANDPRGGVELTIFKTGTDENGEAVNEMYQEIIFDGYDGASVTHWWDGTTLNVVSASGLASADLRGPAGADAEFPSGGTAGQVLTIAEDGSVVWADPTGSGTSTIPSAEGVGF